MTVETVPPRSKRALILSIFLIFNLMGLLALAALLAVLAVTMPGSQQLMFALLASGMFFTSVLLLPAIYVNTRLFLGWAGINLRLPHVPESILLIALTLLWVLTLLLGHFSASTQFAIVTLPILNILAVALPITFFLRLALRKLSSVTAQQGTSVFAVTLITAPILGMLLEVLAMGVILLIVWMAAAASPALTRQITHLIDMLQHNGEDIATLGRALAPLLFTPLGMLTLFGLFSVAVPIIEEGVKVLALLLFARQIKSPIQGFMLGALCGAAFALAENIGFSSTGAADWTQSVLERATAILPHTLNSGILGWGLVSAWQKHSYFKLPAAYFAALLIHGLWNGISLALALSSIAIYATAPYASFFSHEIAFTVGEITMMLGTFGGLIFANYALRRAQAAQPEYNVPPSTPNLTSNGETNGTTDRTF